MAGQSLICPSCGHREDSGERFCERCGMPLIHAEADSPKVSSRRREARKVDPRYAQGEPVKVIGARNQSEAEFIQGLLLEEGIPSMVRRMRGFEVPDFLAAGPRDVLVPEAGYGAARDVLLQSELIEDAATATLAGEGGLLAGGWRVLMWLIAALALVAIVLAIVLGVSGSG